MKPDATMEPANQFRAGDLWENPDGVVHQVRHVTHGIAHLLNMETNTVSTMRHKDLIGWHGKRWTRISSDAQGKS